MTENHTSRFCKSCDRVFYSERSGEFCAACLLTIYEQADFTGVAKPSETDDNELSPADSFRAGWADMLAGRIRPIADIYKELDDAETPTQRLDTDGGDDAHED